MINKIGKLWILFSLLIYACDTLKGHRGISDDINDSKKRNVFVAEYIEIFNSSAPRHDFNIRYSWVEKSWQYGGWFKPNVIGDHYRLIVQLDTIPNGYDDSWIAKMADRPEYSLECNELYGFMNSPLYVVSDTLSILIMQKGVATPDTTEIKLVRKL